MTLKLTERDKKLLVFLAVFVLLVGGGLGLIYPLLTKGQDLQDQLVNAQMEQMEKKQKVDSLSAIKEGKKAVETEVAKIQQEFYEITPSMKIDKMFTNMALSHGAQVKDLDISMPASGENAALPDYGTVLEQRASESEDAQAAPENTEDTGFPGVYTANAEITLIGSRASLQAMLDECAALEPKGQIVEFLWQDNREKESGAYTLALSVNIYMYQSVEEYTMEQQIQQFTEEAGQAAGKGTPEEGTQEEIIEE